ncbi:MAG: MBL fold metallo-hydrolase [Clostridia bacterium]|nr:MBL fold metallo-hydrolase [Clostridia bacterium]MBR4799461.1 MBL fold metallo-hydrolase [Clostridia bacterium]MBR5746653.1 MBL fold metallo-hydrolase [Clostridia bacterium]
MKDMILRRIPVGTLGTNCYVLKNPGTRDAIVIDPGADLTLIQDALFRMDAVCRLILLTHGHFDHILAVGDLRAPNHVPVCIHEADAHMLTERDMFSAVIPYDPRPFDPAEFLFSKEGSYTAAGFEFYVMPTPGHTPGSVCYIFDGLMFTGDTLFKNSIGRTDLGGDEALLMRSLKALKNLPGDYDVYPGHDEPTTLSDERRNNPYLK